jgi:hypothetical protein
VQGRIKVQYIQIMNVTPTYVKTRRIRKNCNNTKYTLSFCSSVKLLHWFQIFLKLANFYVLREWPKCKIKTVENDKNSIITLNVLQVSLMFVPVLKGLETTDKQK